MAITEADKRFLDDTADDIERVVRDLDQIETTEVEQECKEFARRLRESADDLERLGAGWYKRQLGLDPNGPDLVDDEDTEDDEDEDEDFEGDDEE